MTFLLNNLEKYMDKTRIIQKLIDWKISFADAWISLKCSKRTLYRMINRYNVRWPFWLIHWLTWKPSNHQWEETKYGFIKNILRTNKFMRDYSPTKLQVYLDEKYQMYVCKETLRQLMIREWRWKPKPLKRIIKHQKRIRRARYWELVQFDWSYHMWFENWEYWCLLVAIDDATWKIHAKFTKNECLEDVLEFREGYMGIYGKPSTIYVDQHATYKVNNPWDQRDKEYRTRFERWMNRLWVEVIYAKTPEAKWRVERVNRTLQDWLVKKMRELKIKTIEGWNKYLNEQYIERHNKRFWVEAREEWDAHEKMNKEEKWNYYWYFAKEEVRVWRRDWTITYYWREFQLPKNLKLIWRKIIVKEIIYGDVQLYDWTNRLPFTEKHRL